VDHKLIQQLIQYTSHSPKPLHESDLKHCTTIKKEIDKTVKEILAGTKEELEVSCSWATPDSKTILQLLQECYK